MQHSRPITANVKLGLVVSSGVDDLFIINPPMVQALHLIITAGHALWVSCLMPTSFLPADPLLTACRPLTPTHCLLPPNRSAAPLSLPADPN